MSKIGNIAKKVVGMQTVKIDDIIAQFGGTITINGLQLRDLQERPRAGVQFRRRRRHGVQGRLQETSRAGGRFDRGI